MEGDEITRKLLRKTISPLHDPCVLHRKLEYPIPKISKSMAVLRIPRSCRTNQTPRSGGAVEDGRLGSLRGSSPPGEAKTMGLETNLESEIDKSNQKKLHRRFANTTTSVSSEGSKLPKGLQVSLKKIFKYGTKTTNDFVRRFSVEAAESLQSMQELSGERTKSIKGKCSTTGGSRSNESKESQLHIHQSYSSATETPQISSDPVKSIGFSASKPTSRSHSLGVAATLRILDEDIPRESFIETDEEDNVFTSDAEMFIPKQSQRSRVPVPLTKRVESSSGDDTSSIKNPPKKGKTKERSRGRKTRRDLLDNSKKIRSKSKGYVLNFDEIKDKLSLREIKSEKEETTVLDTSGEGQIALWKEEDLDASGRTSEDLEEPSLHSLSYTLDEVALDEGLGELLPKKVLWFGTDFPDRSLNVTSLTPRPARLTVKRLGVTPAFCNHDVTFWTSMDIEGNILVHCSREENEIFRLLLNEETVKKYGVKSRTFTMFFTAANEGEQSVQVDIKLMDKQSFDNSVWTIDNLCRQKKFKIERGGRCQ